MCTLHMVHIVHYDGSMLAEQREMICIYGVHATHHPFSVLINQSLGRISLFAISHLRDIGISLVSRQSLSFQPECIRIFSI